MLGVYLDLALIIPIIILLFFDQLYLKGVRRGYDEWIRLLLIGFAVFLSVQLLTSHNWDQFTTSPVALL